MGEFFAQLFSSVGFEPHGHCYLWQPDILWLNVLSDLCIAIAYYSIPLGLIYFVSQRRDLAYRWVFVMFGAFIFFCGTTHLIEIWTVWHGTYRFEGLVKAVTAGISVVTAAVLWPVIPTALALPSPKQLAQANHTLQTHLAERQRAEASLRASQQMFEQLFEFAPDAMILANTAGEIILINTQAERMFGYSRQDVLGQPIEIFLPERFRERHHQHRAHYMVAPRLRPMGEGLALSGRRKDGSEFPVEISLSPLRLEAEQFVVSAIRDLTERYRLEEELRRTETLVLLGKLATGVSHELRNPLATVTLLMDVLEEEVQQVPAGSSIMAESIAEIKIQLTRVQDLMQDYLSLARLASIQREPTEMGALVNDVAREMEPEARQHGVILHREGLVSLGQLALHANSFRRVLVNLMQNALEAMPQGGSLTLRGRQTDTQIQLEVTDTGIGIPAAECTLIFAPLYTTKPTGTGLGLYLVQEIVTAHGGEIAVQSEVGRGTTFTITLPRAYAEETHHG